MVACLLFKIEKWNKKGFNLQMPHSIIRIIELLTLPDYPGCLCLHLQVDEKIPIWQMALDLESENIMTGYGFGSTFAEAKAEAMTTLSKRINENECQITIHSK
ncbi:hypothetical protein ACS127_18140 [Amphibacillus sp. Q70]|uniref:hypothetical protein n=1 Tax=Amphibacillus sp. Q70 TaxID=3453416 RepID=UPI003F86A274